MNIPKAAHRCTSHEYEWGGKIPSDSCDHKTYVIRQWARLLHVTKFSASILAVTREEITYLTETKFNNIREHYGHMPKLFGSDNASRYVSERVQDVIHRHQCEKVTTSTYTQEEQGITEHVKSTVKNVVCPAMRNAEIDGRYWTLELQDALFKCNSEGIIQP